MFLDYVKHIRAAGKRYFTLGQAMEDLKASRASVLSAIYRMKKQGEIITPAKRLYVIVPPEHQSQGCIPAEELIPILMKYLDVDYYAGLLTAAMYHGATHQKPSSFQIVTNKKIKRKLKFGNVHITCLEKKIFHNLPIKNVVVSTGYLKISSPELTIMDLLNHPRKSGGLNHIATVLSELVESLEPDKLIGLAEHSTGKVWLQRLGYILEKIDPTGNDHTQQIIDKLVDYLAPQKLCFMPLAPEVTATGYPRSKKWMIIENATVESDL